MKYMTIIYVTMAIITFGYSSANTVVDTNDKWRPEREQRAAIGMLSGLLWPLYWAQEVFQNIKQIKDTPHDTK